MDLSNIDPEQIVIGHVGGQLILAAAAEDQALFKRIITGFVSIPGDSLELIAWLARETATVYQMHFGDGWQQRIGLGLLDVEAQLAVEVNEQDDDQDEEQRGD